MSEPWEEFPTCQCRHCENLLEEYHHWLEKQGWRKTGVQLDDVDELKQSNKRLQNACNGLILENSGIEKKYEDLKFTIKEFSERMREE